jgi:hypothetical protein
MPYDKAIAITLTPLPPNTDNRAQGRAQSRLQNWLADKHRGERERKRELEDRKDRRMRELVDVEGDKAGNRERKNQRRDFLRNEYVPVLRQIGMSRANLAQFMNDENCPYVLRDGQFYERGQPDAPLATLHTGHDAFEQVPPQGNLARPVFQKKGVLQSVSRPQKTEYILDDFGRETRRYAYVEKDWDVFLLILGREDGLSGKSVQALGGDPRAISANTAKKWGVQGNVGGRLTPQELAHINQEEGSTVQRAHPLASTSKHLHGNEGYRFGKMSGVILKIDLASVPAGVDDQMLLNLYSWEAQSGDDGNPTIGVEVYNVQAKGPKGQKVLERGELSSTAVEAKAHSDNSTSKNRELMLLRFPRTAIVQVVCHDENMVQRAGELLQGAGLDAVPVVHEAHAAQSPQELYE